MKYSNVNKNSEKRYKNIEKIFLKKFLKNWEKWPKLNNFNKMKFKYFLRVLDFTNKK